MLTNIGMQFKAETIIEQKKVRDIGMKDEKGDPKERKHTLSYI